MPLGDPRDEHEEQDLELEGTAHTVVADLQDARSFGTIVSEPSFHLRRLTTTFKPKERILILQRAAHLFSSITGLRHSPESLVVITLAADDLDEGEMLDRFRLDRHPSKASLSILSRAQQRVANRCLRGESATGLARVLDEVSGREPYEGLQEMLRVIGDALGTWIVTPQQAAIILCCVEENRRYIRMFEQSAEYSLTEAAAFLKGRSRRYWQVNLLDEEAALLRGIAHKDGSNDVFIEMRETLAKQAELLRVPELCGRFEIEPTSAGILVPVRRQLEVATSIREAIARAERDRYALLSLSPRQFERLMETLFRALGFDVELTKATRDGGADLVCMRVQHGIPFRLAVEVKRYKDRPIDVSLVRAFVGANRVFDANRLLYVTTSRYTEPAIQYTAQYASHLLTLKDYDQIREWCKLFLNDYTRLLY